MLEQEGPIRLVAFLGVLVLMVAAESLWPRRRRVAPRTERWFTNFTIVVVDTVLLRLAFPVLAVAWALRVEQNGWGVFNLTVLPVWVEIILAVAILDLAIYVQHVVSHRVPLLWRVHRMHHADRDIDTSTALRFHPIEIALSMVYKLGVIGLLGPAAVAVFLFEVLLNGSAMFNHANLRMPRAIDRVLRAMLVTPDMHRVHHSVIPQETNSNFGFFLSVWDRLFGTYRAQPQKGHTEMTIGLEAYQDEAPNGLLWCLSLPFRKAGSR